MTSFKLLCPILAISESKIILLGKLDRYNYEILNCFVGIILKFNKESSLEAKNVSIIYSISLWFEFKIRSRQGV